MQASSNNCWTGRHDGSPSDLFDHVVAAVRLQMTHLGWRRSPSIVTAIIVSHWRCHQFIDVDAFEASDADIEIFVTRHVRDIDPFESTHAAMLAKGVMRYMVVPSVIRQAVLAGDEAKSVGFCVDKPQARLRAYRAVAFPSARTDVQVGFKADRAAMTASDVGFPHRHLISRTDMHIYAWRVLLARGFSQSCEGQEALAAWPLPAAATSKVSTI
jgi:hypothetical protein